MVLPYALGYEGPAGGIIIYDKGVESYGWRYLEASMNEIRLVNGIPSLDDNTDGYASGLSVFDWGHNVHCANSEAIGRGMQNTVNILESNVNWQPRKNDYAAYLCANLISFKNGQIFDDWFLPSVEEASLLKNAISEDCWTSCDIRHDYDDYYDAVTMRGKRFKKNTKLSCYPMRYVSTVSIPTPHIYENEGFVSITADIPDCKIYYATCLMNNWQKYTQPFEILNDTVVTAYAVKGGRQSAYTVDCLSPKKTN